MIYLDLFPSSSIRHSQYNSLDLLELCAPTRLPGPYKEDTVINVGPRQQLDNIFASALESVVRKVSSASHR